MQYNLTRNEDGEENITVYTEGGEPLVAHSSHPNFDAIKQGVVLNNDESVLDLFDIALAAGTKLTPLTERIAAVNGHLLFDGEEMHGALVDQILTFFEEGVQDWKPLAAFLENLAANPNEHSREELYTFITRNGITITTDGMLVGYKGLRSRTEPTEHGHQFESDSSGTAISDGVVYKNSRIGQNIGSVVEMPRSEVLWDPHNACSAGLHVGNAIMAAGYGDTKFEVHVNPRDVVSVPTAGSKMRVCRYKVVSKLGGAEEITQPVVPAASERDKDGKQKNEVKVGDMFADRDIRRKGRVFEVKEINGDTAIGVSLPRGVKREIKIERLFSRKYKKVTKREAKEILGGAQQ